MVEYDGVAIGNRAYTARNNKNLKQKAISAELGIHQATYSKFELGQYDIHLSELLKLCEILDISASWLIGENSIPQLTDMERLELEKYKNYLLGIRKK